MTDSQNTIVPETTQKPLIHFMGIGGSGLSAIANIALAQGYRISGCDLHESTFSKNLAAKGIKIEIGHNPSHIVEKPDLIVYSAAIKQENEELLAARKLKIPAIKHSQFLGILMEQKYGICISGSHGKTTTDALIGLILKEAQLSPTIEVGGNITELGGNFLAGDSRYFVAEACEYDHSFWHLKPNIAVVLNIELDHPDFYPDMNSLQRAFVKFLNLVPDDGYIVINNESEASKKVIKRLKTKAKVVTFGFQEEADIRIVGDRQSDTGLWLFQLEIKPGSEVFPPERLGLGFFESILPGRHNILNATAALIVSDILGVNQQAAKKVLTQFKGVERRFETVDNRFGITVIADYAHHPSQIKATIKAARRTEYNRLVTVFQPHTYSRTQALFEEFAHSFNQSDIVFVTDTYVPDGRQEKSLKGFTSKDLADAIKETQPNVYFTGSLEKTVEKLRNTLQIGDVVLLLGAGSIYSIGKTVLDRP